MRIIISININMTSLLTDIDTLNVLIKKTPNGILLSKFDDINSIVQGQTLVSMLWNLCNFDTSVWSNPTFEWKQIMILGSKQTDKILRTNIRNLLSHPSIDFTIPENKDTFVTIMLLVKTHSVRC